jgi:Fic family protein
MADNVVEETLPDGTRHVRFQPVPAFRADAAMNELNELYAREIDRGHFHPLLLIGSYVFDFLAIHPFADGNGRMSRLLTLLLLYRQGYEVGRFVSLEKLVADSNETYYDALGTSTMDWHEEEHSIRPWLHYFVGIMVAAYDRFESNTGVVTGRGSKSRSITTFIRASVSEEFSIADIRTQVPSASDSLIRKVLHHLRDAGAIEAQSGGRGATWRRLHRNF